MPLADDVTTFITEQLTRGITPDELAADYDLLDSGLVDSLSLLRLITWVSNRYGIDLDAVDIGPDQFRTVESICRFVEDSAPTPTPTT